MPPPRRNHVNPTHAAFRSSVIIGMGAEYGNQAAWSHSLGMPFVTNLPTLAGSPAFEACDSNGILLNTSAKTTLEQADGNWAAAMAGTAHTHLCGRTHSGIQHSHLAFPICRLIWEKELG